MFVVQRRGGYPWAEGYFNRNDNAALPLELPLDGDSRLFHVYIGEDVGANVQQIKQVFLRLIVLGVDVSNRIAVDLNEVSLFLSVCDSDWKDCQIFSPAPQPPSGGADSWKINPNQKLLRHDYEVAPSYCKLGNNQVTLRVSERSPRNTGSHVKIEKLELYVRYVAA